MLLTVSRMAIGMLMICLAIPTIADDFVVEQNVMIPMRDGVLLATDVYRPAVDGATVTDPLPLVLTRTPYGKDRESTVATAEHLTRHGYVAVIQDMRGRYASQGEFSKYSVLEPADGYDTVEWLAKQPYSDGRVGMWGTSYGAHTQADAV